VRVNEMLVDQFLYSYIASKETYEDGSIIIEEGMKGDWVYVILEGKVKVKKRTEKGMVTLAKLKEGDIFGEIVFLARGKGNRSASIIAADGLVCVGVLDSELLIKDYERISPQLRDLLKNLILKLRNSTDKVCSIIDAS
jgi:CRP-like cAMP-binding protein